MSESRIASAGIVGSGIMARGIARLLTGKNIPTVMLGRSEASLATALEEIEKSRKLDVRKKILTGDEAATASQLLTVATGYHSLSDCNIVIEAVVEDLAIKREVCGEICGAVSERCIIATNTSALRIGDIASAIKNPERFLGLHFMNPANTVNLVEIIRGDLTSDDTIEAVKNFCKTIGRQQLVVVDTCGFVVNRLLMLLINESARMIETGVASPQTIDKAMRLGCGHAMGPAALADFIGLDTVAKELETLSDEFGERYRPSQILLDLVAKGNLGGKTGKGLMGFKKS